MTHKQIAESKNLESQAKQLTQFLNSIPEEELTPIRASRSLRKFPRQCDSRVHILGDYRQRAEKRYRQKAKRQLSKAVNDPQGDHIVEGIAYCQPWDWRF